MIRLTIDSPSQQGSIWNQIVSLLKIMKRHPLITKLCF